MSDLPLPTAPEAERSCLGAVLLDPSRAEDLLTGLSGGDFTSPQTREVFEAIGRLHGSGSPLDVVSVETALKAADWKLDSSFLLALASETPTAENIGHYISLVRKASTLRQIAQVASFAIQAVRAQEDPESVLERTAERLAGIAIRRSDKLTPLAEIIPTALEAIERRSQYPGEVDGLKSGIVGLDSVIGGGRPGQLVVIAGDTGIGKTSLAMQFVMESSRTQAAQWFVVNCEMSKVELAERSLAYTAALDSAFLRTGSLSTKSWGALYEAGRTLSGHSIFLEDSLFSISDIVSRARAWRSRCPGTAAGMVVDYLQLVAGQEGVKRHEEVGGMSRRLKRLAAELQVPIFLLSQLNREGKKAERPPNKHDLRDSGAVEDDANVIILCHRTSELGSPGEPVQGNLIIDKNRSGPLGIAPIVFHGKHYKFADAMGIEP